MFISLIVPVLVGIMSVFQNTLNKKAADGIGLPMALVINNIVLLLCGFFLFFLVRLVPENNVPELFKQKTDFAALGWKIVLPGILGFLIIAMIPYAISKAGAAKIFVGVVVAQVIVSLLWDEITKAVPMTPLKIAGALIALVGAILTSL